MPTIHRRNFKNHPLQLVSPFLLPLFTWISLLTLTTLRVLPMHGFSNSDYWLPYALVCLIASMCFWFRDIISKGTHLGNHTLAVKLCLNIGVALFIVSEALFFLAIFWAYFHGTLSPTVELGPLLPTTLTVLFVFSGFTFTYLCHSLRPFIEYLFLFIKGVFFYIKGVFIIHPLLACMWTYYTILMFNALGCIITSLDLEGFLNIYLNSDIDPECFLNSTGGGGLNIPGGFHPNSLGGAGPVVPGQAVVSQDNYWKLYLLNFLSDKKSTWTPADGNIDIIPPLTEERLAQRRASLQVKDFSVLFTHANHYSMYNFPNSSILRYWQEKPAAFNMVPANTSISDLIVQLRTDLNR